MAHLRTAIVGLSGAALLSACSMAGYAPSHHGVNQPYGPAYGQAYPGSHPSGYGAPCSSASPCGPAGGYSVSGQAHSGSYGVQPSAHAYGTSLPGAYGSASYGPAPRNSASYGAPAGLRGPSRGYGYIDTGTTFYDLDSSLTGLAGRAGYQTANFIGAEIEGSLSLFRDDGVKADYGVGAFGVVKAPLSQRFAMHARAGYQAFQFDDRNGPEIDVDGFAYGAGAEFRLNPKNAIRLDLTRTDTQRGDLDSLTVTYGTRF